MKKIGFIHIALILCITVFLTSCTEEKQIKYRIPKNLDNVSDGTIATNENYSLEWDENAKCVLLKSNKTDDVFSTTPYEFYKSGDTNYNLCSPLNIEYYNTEEGSINTINGYDTIENNTVFAKKIKNGISVKYFFKEAEINVSVTYVLRKDSLQINLNTKDILEYGVNKVINVSVVPYLASVKNSENKSDYLFVPSGSGALMYTDTEPNDNPRTYEGEVYGNDPVKDQIAFSGREEAIRMPVFGAVSNGKAICAIIEKGDGAASIKAVAGNSRNGYSTVYALFNVRGYNNAELNTTSTVILNNYAPYHKEYSIGYYPLLNENADYNSICECYKNYLKGNKLIKSSKKEQSDFQVTFVGGAEVNSYTLGIPHSTLLPITTFNQAVDILKDINKKDYLNIEVLLKGFGKTGLNVSNIAGGYKFNGTLNKNNGQKNLEKYCSENNISLYTDFDTVNFSKSGNGVSRYKNTSLTANMETAVQYTIKRNVLEKNTNSQKIFLVARSKQTEIIDKLLKTQDKNVSGIGLSALGNTAYSDYSTDEYMMKGNLVEEITPIANKIKKSGHSLSLESANSYLAGLADSIYNVPLKNGNYDALDVSIPFYQMVYSGYVPMYSESVNLSSDSNNLLLYMAESGVSPSFMLSNEFSDKLSTINIDISSSIVYNNNKDFIEEIKEKTDEYLKLVKGSKIKIHSILKTGITKTQFENGAYVIVNFTNELYEQDGLSIPKMSYKAYKK